MDNNFKLKAIADKLYLFKKGDVLNFVNGICKFKNGRYSSEYRNAKDFLKCNRSFKNKLIPLEESDKDIIKFEDIKKSGIDKIELNFNKEENFINSINNKIDSYPIWLGSNITIEEIPKVIEWLQKIQLYAEQHKEVVKEMTKDDIEKELGYKIKIII